MNIYLVVLLSKASWFKKDNFLSDYYIHQNFKFNSFSTFLFFWKLFEVTFTFAEVALLKMYMHIIIFEHETLRLDPLHHYHIDNGYF